MTIQKGAEWGTPIERPDDLVVANSDAELAALVGTGTVRSLGLAGGDLHRSLGSPGPRQQMRRLPVDALMVEIDEARSLAVAHVVARRSWWRGTVLAVMNCDHVGVWNVAPRAHPNDGRFDVVEAAPTMPLRSRLQARTRLASGTHVPHPKVSVTTATQRSWRFETAMRIWVDGVEHERCTRLSVAIAPDHFEICV